MSPTDRVVQLRSDIQRWRGRLTDAESTYSQGVASKVAKQFESLLKALADKRLAATGQDLRSLLAEVKYGGTAGTVSKLPLGTTTDLLICLASYDAEIKEALSSATRETLRAIVRKRNDTTHELPPEAMRAAADELLTLVESVLTRSSFLRLFESPT